MSEFTAPGAERGPAQSAPHSRGAEFGVVRFLPDPPPAGFAAAAT
ncbi:hypothetical protein [Nocardia sp. NPDC059691]